MITILKRGLNFFKKSKYVEVDNDFDNISQEEISEFIEAFKSYLEGLKFHSEGDLRKAFDLYNFAVQNGVVNNGGLYKYRGICYQAFGEHLSAIGDFNKSILLSSDIDEKTYYLRSQSKWEVNDFKGYKLDLEAAVLYANINEDKRDEDERDESRGWKINLKFADKKIELKKEQIKLNNEWEEYIKKAIKNSNQENIE